MEVDVSTVRALSSPTRIDILNALDGGATPTDISDTVGKSKSTVVSHLQVLEDADLVEKEVADGRRRVVYRPTREAEAIAQGKTRRVTFSLLSATIAFVGAGAMVRTPGGTTEAGMATADATTSAGTGMPTWMLGVAVGLLLGGAAAVWIAAMVWRLD